VRTFDQAAKAAVAEALRLARNLARLSAETHIRTAYLAAYASGVAAVPEDHLRAIDAYLQRKRAGTP
jgi:hypothetical protein